MDELGRLVAFVIGSVFVGAVSTLISHPTHRPLSEGIIGLVLLCTVCTSVVAFVRGVPDFLPGGDAGEFDSGAVVEVAEEALRWGITEDVCTRYGLNSDEVRVEIFDFSFPDLSVGRVRVELSGSGRGCDYRSLREYVRATYILEGGKCEVMFVE